MARACQRRFSLVHPGYRREERATYYANHREEQLQRVSQRQQKLNLEHPGRQREEKAVYYTNHRQEQLERVREWALTPKGRAYRQKHNHERRALGILDLGAFYAKCGVFEWRCRLCGKELTKTTVTIDHIVPVIKGGTNNIDNLQPLCQPCNGRKFTRSMEEMLIL